MKYNDLLKMSDKELYRKGKSLRDLMIKRHKRLTEKIQQKPGVYSTFGLNEMNKQGIPMISTKQERGQLISNVNKLLKLESMKTGTLTGAKKHMEDTIKNILNIDPSKTKSRMRKQERKDYEEAQNYFAQNPEAMNKFWVAFQHYQRRVAYQMRTSNQELEEFVEKVYKKQGGITANLQSIINDIDDFTQREYEKEQRQRGVFDFNFKGGFQI